jgi:transposase
VVDHDTGRLVWARPGRDKATVRAFFDELGAARTAQITHVSADGADWIASVVAERCPEAVLCADPFHVVRVRREAPCVRGRVRDPTRWPVAAGW